jgi:putative ABC transport system permease protein
VVFAALAVGLAAVGLYGVIASAISHRTRELALRLALGADGADLLRLVMVRSVVLTTLGIVLGAAVALPTTRLLGYLLYNVSPLDPLAFGFAFVVVGLASLAACLVPAWRVMRTDPVLALRV